jgi:nucleoside-diphosphate-sugar epimerase
VFITGAAGFIGRTLAARYRSLGAEVVGVDLAADPSRGIVAGDIAQPGDWQAHADGCDLLIHTAAIVSYAVDLDTAWRTNVAGTRNVLDAARQASVRRLVHFSSVVVFPDLDVAGGMDETTPVRTDGRPYIDTKVAAEQVVLQAHAANEVECVIVRPGDVYGPGSRPWVILPVASIKRRSFLLPAGGKGVFTPVYVDNLVDGVLLAASSPDAAGQIFNISDGTVITCAEYFGHLYRILGMRGPICLPTPLAMAIATGVDRSNRLLGRRTESNPDTLKYLSRTGGYSIAKARDMLGYEPRIDLTEGMRRTEAWLRDNGYLTARRSRR